ncbi:GNAT family N-acetyltransferase [Candidatus Bathyarchaeota archaeon]|nr:GNAT family N-acetyltransferase [Candidatus Bathyarchaeota archaeon]
MMEQEDSSLLVKWLNNPKVLGEFNPLWQTSKMVIEKVMDDNNPHETMTFIIEKKDGSKIGYINYFSVVWDGVGKLQTIAYFLLPAERKKGYCTEATRVIVDYLFLSKEIPCIQATTHQKNIDSQKVLKKVGFKKEGVMRKRFYIRGKWEDQVLYSILKEEWKEPKNLN